MVDGLQIDILAGLGDFDEGRGQGRDPVIDANGVVVVVGVATHVADD